MRGRARRKVTHISEHYSSDHPIIWSSDDRRRRRRPSTSTTTTTTTTTATASTSYKHTYIHTLQSGCYVNYACYACDQRFTNPIVCYAMLDAYIQIHTSTNTEMEIPGFPKVTNFSEHYSSDHPIIWSSDDRRRPRRPRTSTTTTSITFSTSSTSTDSTTSTTYSTSTAATLLLLQTLLCLFGHPFAACVHAGLRLLGIPWSPWINERIWTS